MAFITNGEKTKMGERLAQLAAHAERFDMLVGFFYFSGIRVVSDALADNEKVVWRVLVGMEAEDEASAPRRGASDGDVRDWFYAKMRATLARERLDTQAFHERLAVVERMLREGRLRALETYRPKTDAPNNGQLSARTMAILGLERCAAMLPDDLKAFAKTVGDDIQNYGTIPAFTMRRLAETTTSGNMKDLAKILRDLLASRGADYLAGLRRAADAETVVVTIDKT